MNNKTIAEIKNKLQSPKIILERLSRNKNVPMHKFIVVSLSELHGALKLLDKLAKSESA